MSSFRWTDRAGVSAEIETCGPIEAEYRAVARELLALKPGFENRDDAVFLAALNKAEPLQGRLAELSADLRRWDEAVTPQVRAEARRAVEEVERVAGAARRIRLLLTCYDQYDERIRQRDLAMQGPPSEEQLGLLALQALDGGRTHTVPATFATAAARLRLSPVTCRTPLPTTAQAFEWEDRTGHHHQLRDLRPVEREYVALASELAALLPRLAEGGAVKDVSLALQLASVAVERVTILEHDMERWSAFVIAHARDEAGQLMSDLENIDGGDQ